MEKRNYRPIKLADSLQGINKNLVNKFGKIDYIIYSKWSEIVGSFFVKHTQAEKITVIPKFSEDGKKQHQEKTLYVNVAPVVAVEFQHFQNKILEKINYFFGYQAIHHIKIHQNFTPEHSQISTKTISKFDTSLFNQKKIEINDTTLKINDKELKKSLMNLGLSIAQNEEN